MRIRTASIFCSLCFVLSMLAACGEDTGGGAGAGAEPMLGDPCSTSASCPAGLVCSSSTVRGTCSVGCTGAGLGDSACKVENPAAKCVGFQGQAECAVGCSTSDDCVAGTVCGDVGGEMVCVRDR